MSNDIALLPNTGASVCPIPTAHPDLVPAKRHSNAAAAQEPEARDAAFEFNALGSGCRTQGQLTIPFMPLQPTSLKNTLLLSIPMLLDLIATILLSIGLLVTTASVSQMLRGSGMLFAALFALFFLKRTLNK